MWFRICRFGAYCNCLADKVVYDLLFPFRCGLHFIRRIQLEHRPGYLNVLRVQPFVVVLRPQDHDGTLFVIRLVHAGHEGMPVRVDRQHGHTNPGPPVLVLIPLPNACHAVRPPVRKADPLPHIPALLVTRFKYPLSRDQASLPFPPSLPVQPRLSDCFRASVHRVQLALFLSVLVQALRLHELRPGADGGDRKNQSSTDELRGGA